MDVSHVAKLANLPLTPARLSELSASLSHIVKLVDHIQQLNTTAIQATSQVTGLVNVTRPDVIDPSRVLTQAEALSNAPATANGYFKVPAIFF